MHGHSLSGTMMELNRSDSFELCMEVGTHHSPCTMDAWFEGIMTTTVVCTFSVTRKSWSCAEPYRISARKAANESASRYEDVRGGPVLPSGCCSRFVWPMRSTSLLARAPIVVCSRGSQQNQKYCVALSEKSWCSSSVCDEYMLSLLAKWLGIHLTRVHGPSSDQ